MAGDGETDLDLDSVIAAARQRFSGQRGGHSPVYELMWNHYARLAPELGRPRRLNWAAMAQSLGDQGVLDGAGQALASTSAETVRKTWWKVCRDKEAVAAGATRERRKAKQGHAAPLPPSPAGAGPASGYRMLPHGVESPEEPPPRFTFEFARAKDWAKEADISDE